MPNRNPEPWLNSAASSSSPNTHPAIRKRSPRMEDPYHKESGAPRSAGVEIGSGSVSNNALGLYYGRHPDDEYRYSISVWLRNLEANPTALEPELPPVFVVKFPELVEKAWGWQRLIPYIPGCVDWSSYKSYLEEFSRKNDGEVAALCANKKPDKDKDYFARAARCADKKAGLDAADCNAMSASFAARQCIDVEHDFRWCFRSCRTAEEISLSCEIEEFANRVIESPCESSATTVAGLVCLTNETDLLFELMEEGRIDVTEMIALSKKVRRSALNLLLHVGPECSAAIGAMVGMAKEARFMRYLLSRVDLYVEDDFDFCDMIRAYTEEVFIKLLEEFSCKNPNNGDGNGTPASAKSEKHIGVRTVGHFNCKESGSMQDHEMDMDEYCGKDNLYKFHLTINKDVEVAREAFADLSSSK